MKLLSPGGSMWVVIQKKQGAPSALAKLESLFADVEEVTKDKGYRIFRGIKVNEYVKIEQYFVDLTFPMWYYYKMSVLNWAQSL